MSCDQQFDVGQSFGDFIDVQEQVNAQQNAYLCPNCGRISYQASDVAGPVFGGFCSRRCEQDYYSMSGWGA